MDNFSNSWIRRSIDSLGTLVFMFWNNSPSAREITGERGREREGRGDEEEEREIMREKEEIKGEITPPMIEIISVARREESGRRLGRTRRGEWKGEGGEISPSSCYAHAWAREWQFINLSDKTCSFNELPMQFLVFFACFIHILWWNCDFYKFRTLP